jgi:hypothetical protein
MSTAPTLRPPSSINDERTQIHLGLSARLFPPFAIANGKLDLTDLLIRTVTAAPQSVLPYLLWEFDVWDIAAPMLAFGVSSMELIQNAIYLHQIQGTVYSIQYALELMGLTNVVLYEGAALWGGAYPVSQAWAVFRVSFAEVSSLNPTQLAQVTQVINFLKPARCLLDAIIVGSVYFADDEIPTISGNTATLTAGAAPSGGLLFYVNGILWTQYIDYILVGTTVTFINTLPSGAIVRTWYAYNVAPTNIFYVLPTGTKNGSNLVFNLSLVPSPANSLEFYRNGQLLTYGVDFTLSGAIVTLSGSGGGAAPISTDVLFATFRIGTDPLLSSIGFASDETPSRVGGNTYSLLNNPNPSQSLRLFRNGALLVLGTDYTISTNQITITSIAIQPTDVLLAYYRFTI